MYSYMSFNSYADAGDNHHSMGTEKFYYLYAHTIRHKDLFLKRAPGLQMWKYKPTHWKN